MTLPRPHQATSSDEEHQLTSNEAESKTIKNPADLQKALAEPITSPSLDKKWEIPISIKNIKQIIFSYCGDNKSEPHYAAKYAAISNEFKTQYTNEFDQEVKVMLQHTAKCDYNISICPDDKTFGIEEDTLYLCKHDEGIQYQFITHNESKTVGIIRAKEIEDELWGVTVKGSSIDYFISEIIKVLAQKHSYHVPLKAVWMARQNHALILAQSTFTEEWCGQREWNKPLSSLQYAAWAGDSQLVDQLLEIVPKDLMKTALTQLQDVQNNHLQRKHLSAVLELRDEFKRDFNAEWTDAMKLFQEKKTSTLEWRKGCIGYGIFSGYKGYVIHRFGKKQLSSVVNLLQWYCSSVPFKNPVPTFREFPQIRTLKSGCSMLSLLSGRIWRPVGDAFFLGTYDMYRPFNNVCLLKGEGNKVFGFRDDLFDKSRGFSHDVICRTDAEAIEHFCKVRVEDLANQIQKLQQQLENKPLSVH